MKQASARELTVDLTPPDTTDLTVYATRAQALVVDSPQTKVHAASLLVEVKGYIKTLAARFSQIKKPLNDARTALLKEERLTLAGPKALAAEVEAKILEYTKTEEATRLLALRVAEAKARAEAEQARVNRIAELRAAAKTASPPAAKQLRTAAKRLKTDAVTVAPVSVPDLTPMPVSTRVTHDAVITDMRELVNAVAAGEVSIDVLEPERLIASHPVLNALARKAGPALAIPGVQVRRKERLQ